MCTVLAFTVGKLAGSRARQCILHVETRPWRAQIPESTSPQQYRHESLLQRPVSGRSRSDNIRHVLKGVALTSAQQQHSRVRHRAPEAAAAFGSLRSLAPASQLPRAGSTCFAKPGWD
jgi:hypothetical protein